MTSKAAELLREDEMGTINVTQDKKFHYFQSSRHFPA